MTCCIMICTIASPLNWAWRQRTLQLQSFKTLVSFLIGCMGDERPLHTLILPAHNVAVIFMLECRFASFAKTTGPLRRLCFDLGDHLFVSGAWAMLSASWSEHAFHSMRIPYEPGYLCLGNSEGGLQYLECNEGSVMAVEATVNSVQAKHEELILKSVVTVLQTTKH